MADLSNFDDQAQQPQTEVKPQLQVQVPPKRVPNNWGNRLAHIIFSFGLGYGAIEMYRQNMEGYWLLAGLSCLTLIGALRDTMKNKA
ncbi:MAG: hypothetical protein ACFB11_02565 [Paracoccaceae bacterium]